MDNIFTHVPYKDTGYFSKLVTDYISNDPGIKSFYNFSPTAEGLEQAINERGKFPVDRKALVAVLTKQYEHLPKHAKTEANIAALLNENTFTVCTAHQPNLLTGYLYFVHKILHAVKLAEELCAAYPDKYFVPVYYMGSEDNDLEELATFKFRGDKYVWDGGGQTGAVGRMDTVSLKTLLNNLFKTFGPPGSNCEELQGMITRAYLEHKTVGAATQYLVNELFGRYGLVVVDPDDATLKASFIPIMEDELLHQAANPIITKQIEALGAHYKIQAHPREINLFYLADQVRERIVKEGDKWSVLNTYLQFSQAEILDELKQHPERFSPNVMLRGLFQETILPNVAFIGGGAEVAYWLQLNSLFRHYSVYYPVIFLRQSVLWINETASKLRKQADVGLIDIFKPEADLERDYMVRHRGTAWQTKDEAVGIESLLAALKQKAINVDATLGPATEAALTRMKHQLTELEKKMLRAEKRKLQVEIARIERVKKALFPAGSLQERVENFAEYYLQYGGAFFDTIKDGIKPLTLEFLIIE